MTKAEAIAFHGWAFDSGCWEPWNQLLNEEQVELECAERGYFGSGRMVPVFSDESKPKVILTHSFGLHLCNKKHLGQANLLVIFNGFFEFHPVAAQYRRRSRMVVQQMIDRLQAQPRKVLEEFYKNTFLPQQPPPVSYGEASVEHLLEDLKRLNSSKADIAGVKKADKICILHGSEDRIVPHTRGRQLYELLGDRCRYFEIQDAGHGLPFTHTEECWQFIKTEIAELIS